MEESYEGKWSEKGMKEKCKKLQKTNNESLWLSKYKKEKDKNQ